METNLYDKKVEVNYETMKVINDTRKWTLFLSILGFIGIGLIVILGLIIGPLISSLSGQRLGSTFPPFLFGFIYLIIAVIYFFPVFFLYKFSVFAKRAFNTFEPENMHLAFKNLRTHYQILGVITIIFVGLYVIVGVIAALVTAFSRF